MFYLIIIFASTFFTVLNNSISTNLSIKSVFGETFAVAVGAIAIFIVDALLALIIRRLTPKSWYSPERSIFRVSKKERDFYNRIAIKKWKFIVPELGCFTGFSKRNIEKTDDVDYLSRFLTESNYGVVIHLANALFGFVIAFIPICSSPSVWIPIYVINFVLSMLPVFILRYTSHTLFKLYKRQQKSRGAKEENKAKA